MKKLFLLIFTITALASCSGGGGGSDNAAATVPASITVTPANNNLSVGRNQQFTATGAYSDGTTKELTALVTWSSSDPAVATVDSNGMVTTVAAGAVTISATSGGVTGTTTLTVPSTILVFITVTSADPSIALGTSLQLTATGTFSDGSTQNLTPLVTWTSNSAVATIDSSGKATAVGVGTTPITATSTLGGTPGSTTLTVTDATLTSIDVTPAASSNPIIALGTSQQFTAIGNFSDGSHQVLTTSVTWTSNSAVATIDSSGKATAVGVGTTAITATSTLGGIPGSTSLNVTDATFQSISVTPQNPSFAAGKTQQFNATGNFPDGSQQVLTNLVTWSSADPAVAKIDLSGKFIAEGVGTTTITATFSGGKSGSTTLTVTPAAVTGIWTGTYTIVPKPTPLDPSEENKTYNYQLEFKQSGDVITGTAKLREGTSFFVTSEEFTVNMDGRKMDFIFTYKSPVGSVLMVNDVSASITDDSMTGSVDENFSSGFNCRYIFDLKR